MMQKKILIVDDALFHRMLCREILSAAPFKLLEAVTGEEALEKVKHEKPELVLLDITLPGKDGLEVLDEIRRISQNTKVIMVTAQAQKSFIMTALKKGASDYVTKPINPEKLLSVVHKILG
jgi:two-component system chemotaxis response regulator CheY